MQLAITFRHLDPTEALKAHVRDRVEHIQRFVDRATEAHAVLHVENLHHHAEITVKAGRFLLRGTARTPDMYASIDAASDRIERQLKKHKDKLHTAHKSNGAPHNLPPAEVRHQVFDLLGAAEKRAPRLVKTEEFQAKPMSIDEAILQLDLLDSKFFVFQNERDRAVNVVYRREDGSYGLIETRT